MQSISVIIPTKDRWKEIYRCIESIIHQTVLPNTVIVVDASEKKGLEEILDPLIKGKEVSFKYIHTQPGLTRQRNIGIKHNSHDIILFLDDDVVLERNFLNVVLKAFDEYSEVMGVTGKILNQPILSPISTFIRKMFFLPEVKKGEVKLSGANNSINPKINEIIPVHWLAGACCAYRNKVFTEFMFDEVFTGYSYLEDLEFSFRVHKKYLLLFLPEAKLYHYHSDAPKTRLNTQKKHKMYVINYFYFFKKNMPQTMKHKWAHYWSYIGLIIKSIFLTRSIPALIGTFQGIWKNITGRNPLVKQLETGDDRVCY